MKKIMVLAISIVIVGIAIYLLSKVYLSKHPNFDKSNTFSYSTNGNNYETTGTPPISDIDSQLALREGVKLLSSGPVRTKEFELKMPGDGSIAVFINVPTDENKQKFLQWLKDNGYSHIDPAQFTYSYSR